MDCGTSLKTVMILGMIYWSQHQVQRNLVWMKEMASLSREE